MRRSGAFFFRLVWFGDPAYLRYEMTEPTNKTSAMAEKLVGFLKALSVEGELTPELKRQLWGDGPWVDEADLVEFRVHSLPCRIVRHRFFGAWLGYVAVPPGHELYGVDVSEIGSLFSAPLCVAFPGEPNDGWWFGFDCMHGSDLVPSDSNWMTPVMLERRDYRTQAFVHDVTTQLADELNRFQRPGTSG